MLHMGHAGHGQTDICFGLFEKGAQQLEKRGSHACCRVLHEQAEISGNEFIAAAAGVQFPAERAEFMNQRAFHEVVDIFGRRAFEERGVVLYAPFQIIERQERVVDFRGGEDADSLQRFGPGAIDGDLVGQETTVERERTLERVELFVGFALEAAAPEAIVFALRLCGH